MSAEIEGFPGGLVQPLDRSGEVPLGAQLTWRLRMLIAGGALASGDRLPSARELARAVGVNVNTVFAVYGRLEGEGLIETQHGRGSFVLTPPPNAAGIVGLVQQTASAARTAGLDPRDIAMSLFANEGSAAAKAAAPRAGAAAASRAPAPSDAAAQRRRLREEIDALELERTRLQASVRTEDQPLPAQARAQPRLLDAAALQTVRDQLQARVDALRLAADERQADAQARRRSRATTTLDQARAATPGRRPSARVAARPPLVVHWTPDWGTT